MSETIELVAACQEGVHCTRPPHIVQGICRFSARPHLLELPFFLQGLCPARLVLFLLEL